MNKQLSKAALTALLLLVPMECNAATALEEPGVNLPAAKEDPAIGSEETAKKDAVSGAEFYLHKVELMDKGGISVSESKLLTFATPYVKQVTDMAKLNAMTEEMTRYVRAHGYPTALVYVPQQEITRSTLKVAILPGRIDKVNIDNQAKLDGKVVQRLTKGLRSGDIITSRSMETALYNLNNLPGVKAAGVLSPGSTQGTSDLTITVRDDKQNQTLLYAENYGSKYSGRYRYGFQETFNNLTRQGDMLRVGTLISNGDLRNYYAAYEMNVGRSGSTLGLSISHMNYELGSYLANLGMKGKANTVSLYGKTPIFQTSGRSLAVTYGYDYRKLEDKITNPSWDSERHSHALHVGLSGSARQSNSAVFYDITLTHGTLGTDSVNAEQLDNISHFSGKFTKGNANITAVQALGHSVDILFKGQGQMASKNLDSSERFYLGGAQGVRAYPQGEASGDQGILGTAELRYHTPVRGLTLSCYLDGGEVRLQKSGTGTTSLMGWGIGVSYSKPNSWFARLDYARRIGGEANLSDAAKAKDRTWFILGKIW